MARQPTTSAARGGNDDGGGDDGGNRSNGVTPFSEALLLQTWRALSPSKQQLVILCAVALLGPDAELLKALQDFRP